MSGDPAGLITRLRQADGAGQMKFGVCQGRGFITSNSEEAIRLLCDLWNYRHFIADELEKLPGSPMLVEFKHDR